MKLTDYKGYALHIPDSGGKAGKGRNKTSTVQVRRDSCIKKQFRFNVDIPGARQIATAKAMDWIFNNPATS